MWLIFGKGPGNAGRHYLYFNTSSFAYYIMEPGGLAKKDFRKGKEVWSKNKKWLESRNQEAFYTFLYLFRAKLIFAMNAKNSK